MHGKVIHAQRIFIVQSQKKRPVQIPRGTLQHTLNTDLREMVAIMNELVQDKVKWQAFCNAVITVKAH